MNTKMPVLALAIAMLGSAVAISAMRSGRIARPCTGARSRRLRRCNRRDLYRSTVVTGRHVRTGVS